MQLPVSDYGFGSFVLNHFLFQTEAERKGAPYPAKMTQDWTLGGILKDAAFSMRYYVSDDRELVDRVVPKLTIVKLSTMVFQFVDVNVACTHVRIMQAASDVERYPTTQATIANARRAVHTP